MLVVNLMDLRMRRLSIAAKSAPRRILSAPGQMLGKQSSETRRDEARESSPPTRMYRGMHFSVGRAGRPRQSASIEA